MTHDEKIVEAVARALDPDTFKQNQLLYDFCIAQGDSQEEANRCADQMHPLSRAMDKARAAITAYQAEAWQPIETAPKDGSRMLFFTGVAWVGYYRTGREPGAPPDADWSKPGWTRLGFCDVGIKPTHWQPLPPAPKASP